MSLTQGDVAGKLMRLKTYLKTNLPETALRNYLMAYTDDLFCRYLMSGGGAVFLKAERTYFKIVADRAQQLCAQDVQSFSINEAGLRMFRGAIAGRDNARGAYPVTHGRSVFNYIRAHTVQERQ
jgi:hypothetical protein